MASCAGIRISAIKDKPRKRRDPPGISRSPSSKELLRKKPKACNWSRSVGTRHDHVRNRFRWEIVVDGKATRTGIASAIGQSYAPEIQRRLRPRL
jgi:hypothetical protein